MNEEDRVNRMEDVIVLLKDLIVRHEERLDTFDVDFERSRNDFDFKMNALIDAQLKNEEGIAELRARVTALAIERAEAQLKKLLTKSAQTKLIDRSIALVGDK